MEFICYQNCSTCKKAEKWLNDHAIAYEARPMREQNPSYEELDAWSQESGLPLRRFFNTSGQQYRALALKDRLPQMSMDEQYALLATDGMLVKRPMLIGEDFVLVGFRESEWAEKLK